MLAFLWGPEQAKCSQVSKMSGMGNSMPGKGGFLNVTWNPALDVSLFRAADHFGSLGFWDGAPKFRLGCNKFDGNLRLAHQGWT